MNGQPQVMVVDDDAAMRKFLCSFLSERGFGAVSVGDAAEAIRRYHAERPAVVILDLVMPGGMDGLGALAAFKKIDRDVPVIVISGQGRTTAVVQAMKLGACDFVSKPFNDGDLEAPLVSALKHYQLSREVASLREQLDSQSESTMLFGHSEQMAEVQDVIKRVADTDVTVLIRGESGTGKELVARALCSSSPRRHKTFVKVNCAALPAELVESELFGFERGAFTGAIQQKPGKFEFANHGTMFLDEVGEMSPALQAKLLQVLQDGEFSRLGGKTDVRVDVRLVAATNRDLEHMVALGTFREDLFFRLNVVSIHIPPLRERRQEIPVLTEYFLKKCAVQYNRPYTGFSSETMRLFMDHDWPGNVRELENLVKRAVVLGDEAAIRKELAYGIAAARRLTLPPPRAGAGLSNGPGPAAQPRVSDARPAPTIPAVVADDGGHYSLKEISRTAAREAEREVILKTLQRTRWNRKETAGLLGISYKALLYKIKENDLDKTK